MWAGLSTVVRALLIYTFIVITTSSKGDMFLYMNVHIL